MPELNWLGDKEAKRAARRVPYRLRMRVDPVWFGIMLMLVSAEALAGAQNMDT